ncbi:MAG: hypothetical protein DRJ26_02520 [Candidatus Methanomethylicota archaeon]|uniref:DUF106 domain-containing protein n=1 Tax=Thermoproteota archaeon TaxID=2056631 RepID=A0A497EY98_9CREN|nr:MAG: hypothetical protein DRJ20_01755 [Candidatus Verstraetearchaeota archaeon]RLE53963.1 MAG: hypothetical protein DRJ26_02520 [Candidatus Verstraetearchaeota archaeon]
MLDWLVKIISDFLGPYKYPPLSTISVLIISIGVGLTSVLANFLLVDVKKLRSYSEEIKEWRREMRKALLSGDKKQIVKLRKKEPYIRRIEAEVMAERMKPSLIFMLPLWIFFIIFAGAFTTEIGYVAQLPFSIPFAGDKANFVTWYIICSILTLPLLQKAFKLSF